MVKWAIQREDERWLGRDYGWTLRQERILRFNASCEAEEQAVRLITSGISCHTVAVPDEPQAAHEDGQ